MKHYLLVCFAALYFGNGMWAVLSALPIQGTLKIGNDGRGIFAQGEAMALSYTVSNKSHKALKVGLRGTMNLLGETTGAYAFNQVEEIAPKQSKTFVVSYQAKESGVYFIFTRLQVVGMAGNIDSSAMAGYALDYLPTSPLTRPDDFHEFWAQSKRSLASVAPAYKLIYKPELSSPAYKTYLLEMQSWGNITIRGWYRLPARARAGSNLPVVLQLPSLGGSFYGVKDLAERPRHGVPLDFAVLALNIRAHGNSRTEEVADYNLLINRGVGDKNLYFYRGAILDALRGIDFLATRKELDLNQLVVEGASQGGGLAMIVTALDARVRVCAPDVPFLCDFPRLTRQTKWVSSAWAAYKKNNPRITDAQIQQTLAYFDVRNFADSIRVPILMSVGLQDWTCPASTCLSVYQAIASPRKRYFLYPGGRHDGGGNIHRRLKFDWIRKQLTR